MAATLLRDSWVAAAFWLVGAAAFVVGAVVWAQLESRPQVSQGPLYCLECGRALELLTDRTPPRWYCSKCKEFRDESGGRIAVPHRDDFIPL